jgi:hypothetical protein
MPSICGVFRRSFAEEKGLDVESDRTMATSRPPVSAMKCWIRSIVAGNLSSDILFGDSNSSRSARFDFVTLLFLGNSIKGNAISCDSSGDSAYSTVRGNAYGYNESDTPLTARSDGETKRGTIDAKDERRRSDVQNMVSIGSKVRIKALVHSFFCREDVCNHPA